MKLTPLLSYGSKIKEIKTRLHNFLLPLAQALDVRVPKTVQFDESIPYTKINGYKYHTEIFGKPESTPIIVVHGGPGLGCDYLKPLKALSKDYRVIFYDQRGAGLSPRVDKQYLTLEQSLDDLHAIAGHFSNAGKVKLIGHSWGAMLVAGYLSKHPETVSQAVIVEPAYLDAAAAKEYFTKFKEWPSIWEIVPYALAYPFVRKEDGHEGYDYAATKIANRHKPGPPYNCEGQDIPPNIFKRVGYASISHLFKPAMNKPNSLTDELTNGICEFHGDLMLISSECSIIGSVFQEKYHLSKLPSQTVHVKAVNMGHHMLTLNPEWSIQTIAKFFKQ